MKNMLNKTLQRGGIALVVAMCLVVAGPAFAGKKKRKKGPARPAKTAKKAAEPKKADAKTAVARPAPKPAVPAGTPVAAAPVTADNVGAPSDGDILEAETVAVQPVLGVGAGENVAWYDIANYAKIAKVDKDEAKEVLSTSLEAPKAVDGGFGFAGASAAKDIRVLHHAMALGFIPALVKAGGAGRAKGLAEKLKKSHSALADLTPKTQASALMLVAVGTVDKEVKGKLIGMILGEALKAGVRGVAKGPQRAHGYYLAGIWAGGAMMYGMLGGNDTYADMAEPIAQMLDKDASFGGSDRVIAKHLRNIAKQLKAKKPSVRTIKAELSAIMKVKADK